MGKVDCDMMLRNRVGTNFHGGGTDGVTVSSSEEEVHLCFKDTDERFIRYVTFPDITLRSTG